MQVIKQYGKEIEEGLMGKSTLGDASGLNGHDLTIAATGAIAKKGTSPGGEARVIYDGTNGIYLNYGIKVRDQVKFPAAPDNKAVLAELFDEGGDYISLLFDVSKAHRRVPVLPEEWGRQACQVSGTAAEASKSALRASAEVARKDFETHGAGAKLKPRSRPRIEDMPQAVLDETVWLNKVGTFGVASAGY